MKKIFSIFAAVLFAGSMMAADAKVVLDFTSGGVIGENSWGFPTDYVKTAATYSKGEYTIGFGATSDGHKAMFNAQKDGANQPTGDTIWTGIIFGKKTGAALELPKMNFAVSKIVVRCISSGGSASVKYNIFVGEDAVSAEVAGSNQDHEMEIAKTAQAANTQYVLKLTSDKYNCQISKIEFYEAVEGAPENPVFSLAGGVFTEEQTVTLSCPTEGADIYYTLDGTDPTAASTKYTAALDIDASVTVKAIAIKNSLESSIVSATYKIVTLAGEGTNTNPFTVEDVVKLENSKSGPYWVKGYILGSAATGGKKSATIAKTNLCLGDSATQVENCIAVELPSGDLRDAINLEDHASYVGQVIWVYGSLEAYFSFFGVKGTSKYSFSVPTAIDQTVITDKAIKLIENGQIVIIKNGVRYNALGIRL